MNLWRWLRRESPPKVEAPSRVLTPRVVYRSDQDHPLTWAEVDQTTMWFAEKLDRIEQKLDKLLAKRSA